MDKSKKQEIINACMVEFSKHGYEKANTNTICEQAGVSKGLLFHYFGSKKSLYILVIEKCIEDTANSIKDINVDNMDFLKAMLWYSQVKWEFFTVNPLHYNLLTQAFFNTPEDVKEHLKKRYAELTTIGAAKINELIDKLDLKEGVLKENALQLILAVSGIIEKKHSALITKSNSMDNMLLETIKKDYIELIKMVLYGISN
ncbi:MAG TPA: hypothetical protein DCP51_03570 [Clostridiales bacterium]|nr:hypothetical protein [Clostridiales bacterium]